MAFGFETGPENVVSIKVVGGGGGGRPNMAQAGGKNPAGVDEALAKVAETVESQVR